MALLSTITCVVDVQMAHARPFSTSTLQDLSNNVRKTSRWGVLTPAIELWSFGSPGGLQVPTFGSASFIFTLVSKWGCDKEPWANSDSQNSPRPRLGGSHHLPPYSIFYGWPHDQHPKCHFVLGLPSGSPEIPTIGILATLGAHNFMCRPPIEMRFQAKL
jgi:hypothetical protein